MVRRYYDFSAIPAPTKPKEGTHRPRRDAPCVPGD